MFGSIRINFVIAVIGFLFIFAISLISNTLGTSFMRSVIAFIASFLITFGLRFMLNFIFDNSHIEKQTSQDASQKQDHAFDQESTAASETDEEKRNVPEDAIERTAGYVRELLQEKK